MEAVKNVEKLTKLDMKLNDALLSIPVDLESYTATPDGEVLACAAAGNGGILNWEMTIYMLLR
ncbi:hypothetical protein BT93_B2943 [Corymbia citriodora subsp. variegata]|nr:hypothetical protein BT93_B2943 [Corymbia citriodora subsp. variegata]